MSEAAFSWFVREAMALLTLLRRMVIVFMVCTVLMLIPVNLFDGPPIAFYMLRSVLNSPLASDVLIQVKLIIGDPVATLNVVLLSALFFGMLVSSPINIVLFYRYLRPALYPHERKLAVRFTLFTAGLFYAGIVYGLLVVTPTMLKIMILLGRELEVEPYLVISSFYEFFITTVMITAIGFLIPVIVYIIGRVFHIDLNLRKYWRYIFVISYAILAPISPDPTPITDLLIIGPPLTLGVLAEILALRKNRNKNRE